MGWSVWRRLGWGRQPCGGLRAAGAEPGFFPPNRLPKSMMQSGIAMATAASRAPLPAPRWGSGSLRAVRGGRKKKRIKEQNKTWNQKRWRRSCNGNGGAAGAASALRAPRKWIGASRAPRGAGALPGRWGGPAGGAVRRDGNGMRPRAVGSAENFPASPPCRRAPSRQRAAWGRGGRGVPPGISPSADKGGSAGPSSPAGHRCLLGKTGSGRMQKTD